ncbi:MAG TPA: AAA family ATPase, partial [Rhizomicrobium sp.]|nr:AAA family ATPase [Rhizomicrobium sp.]
MLASLKIRDLVLIEDVSLEFAAGLNVLTGETGAGKSILLDALGLAAGSRAGARSSVRQGAQQGAASAIFEPDDDGGLGAFLAENAIPAGDDLILRRTISADGRTRGFVNDEPVGVGLLRDLGATMVEIHGQSDDRGLFDTSTHRKLLDAFGAHQALAAGTAETFSVFETARASLAALRAAAAGAAVDAEFLRHAADELSALDAQEGEEERLASERALLMNAGRIAEDVASAVESIAGERGAESALASALKRLARMNEDARKAVGAAETALEQAFSTTEEARRDLESFLSKLEVDAGELERKEERLFAIRAASRKYA